LNFPKLILADEPTANLDPDTANDIMDLLHFINQKYKTAVLMATHNYLLMEKFHGNIIRVVDGTIKQVHLETV
jgi:cell division transport system ATP-binding protein